MRNKRLLLQLLALVFGFVPILKIKGQVLPNNCPPVIYSGTFSSGTYTNAACNAELNPLSINGAANYDIKARNYIHVPAGNYTLVSGLSTGSFHAHIEPAPFEVVSYHPNGFNIIPQYDKFELGIKLPQNLTDSINSFFGDRNLVGTSLNSQTIHINPKNGYGNVFDSTFLNPYDPEKISVEATFSFPGKLDQVVYGFYYRKYNYNFISGNAVNYPNMNWVEDTALEYHWRVRFTPKFVGQYKVTWKIKTNNGNTIAYEDDGGQSFSTIASVNRGFIRLDSNKVFMVTQPDENGPQKSIIPIGMVVPFPAEGLPGNSDGVPINECPSWGCNSRWGADSNNYNPYNYSYPSRFFKHREQIRKKLALNGANIVRVFSGPDSYDIEWENKGIYDADRFKPLGDFVGYAYPGGDNKYYKGNNRQAILWELDSLIEMARVSDMYVQWVTDDANQNGFVPHYNFPITKNPYYGVITTAQQFFTSPIAKKLYKNRLRYMIARYGYSTNLACFELLNEAHNLDPVIPQGSTVNELVKPWLEEMLTYIKGPYPALNHNDHLFTVSFEPLPTSNLIGTTLGLDFVSEHPYAYDNAANTYSDLASQTQITSFLSGFKPCQAGETGIRASWSCWQNPLPEAMAPSFHSLLWASTFIRGLTSGLNNWSSTLENTVNIHPCGDIVTNHFKPLQAFINDREYARGKYAPRYASPNLRFEAFYMVNNFGVASDRAIGYVRNKSFWWSNFMNQDNGIYYDPNLTMPPGCTPIPVPLPMSSGFYTTVAIDGFQSGSLFMVDWYDTYSDPPILISSALGVTTFSGEAIIYPPLFGGSCTEQEFAFKIHPPGQQRSSSNINGSVSDLSPDTLVYLNKDYQDLFPSKERIELLNSRNSFRNIS